MGQELRVVMVEDVESDAELAERELKRAGLAVLARRAERRREEQLLALEHTVVRHIASADSASIGLKAIIRAICESEGWDVGRYFRADEKAGVLRFSQAWGPAGSDIERFIEKSRDIRYAPGVGPAGQVWQSGQPLWVADITRDSRIEEAGLARNAGLHGGFVFPVNAEGKTIGVLAFDSREVREPEDRLLRAMHAIGSQIGQFLARQEQQRHIARLNRIYAVLSGINSTIVRVREREELLREACGIVVRAGGFRLAWLGLVDAEANRVKPMAWEGVGEDYIGMIPLGLDENAPGEYGLAGRAVKERKAMVVDDMTVDPRITLRKETLERGFRSLAILPLLVAEEPVGVLALYADSPGFFDDEDEMRLLLELAADI